MSRLQDSHAFIPHSFCSVGNEEAVAVSRVLNRNYVGVGVENERLETVFLRRTGQSSAFAVASGSYAILLALKSLELPPHSTVAVPVLCCPSVLSAVQLAGYTYSLVDIDQHLRLSIRDLPGEISVVIAPHAYGAPLDVNNLQATGLPWIEDCATSPSAQTSAGVAGSHGDFSVFSFGSTKYITGGTGGLLLCKTKTHADRIELLRKTDTSPSLISGDLSDINAAVILSQFEKLEEFSKIRKHIAQKYLQLLRHYSWVEQLPEPTGHAFYRFIFKTSEKSSDLLNALQAAGIDARGSVNPWLDRFSNDRREFRNANTWKQHLVSLPIHPGLSNEDVDRVLDALRAFDQRKV